METLANTTANSKDINRTNFKIWGKDISEEARILYAYRLLSWVLTSAVYLAGEPRSTLLFKLGVTVSLLICSKFITDLYIKFKVNKGIQRTLVLTETAGITILLLPTGGLNSPFIWYALNPTLTAASYLPVYFCWLNLSFYLAAGTVMTYFLFNQENLYIFEILASNTNTILVFALITLAVQLLANLAKRLAIQANELEYSNRMRQESMEYIMSLYQLIEAFNNHSSKSRLFEALAIYTAKLTGSNLCLIWLPYSGEKIEGLYANTELDRKQWLRIRTALSSFDSEIESNILREIYVDDKIFLAAPIISPTRRFGIITVEKSTELKLKDQIPKLMEFITGLCAVTLERFYLEEIDDSLLVMEEQNRIANEIHDSVSQRLFSISYAIHGMLGRWDKISINEIKTNLREIKESANLAMQELRNAIYRLSTKKKGEKTLKITLNEFLNSISLLNNVAIDFDVKGDDSLISLSLKQGISRIIREACSNSIRHGDCKNIKIEIEINRDLMKIYFADDGKGFSENILNAENSKGLGISNMKNLAESFGGHISIESHIGRGTEISIDIPIKGNE